MVAFSKNPDGTRLLDLCRARFAEMLPQIRQEASAALSAVSLDRRAALVEEVIERAFGTLLKLAERGQMQIAYAKPLTMVAVKQLHGRPTNVRSG